MRTVQDSFSLMAHVAVAVALAVLTPTAHAASTWSMGTTATVTSATGNLNNLCASHATTKLATGACGTGLSVAGWSTGSRSAAGPTTSATFNAAAVYDWGTGGLGVVAVNESSGPAGPHATDNSVGTDAMLLNFTTASNLSGVMIGWNGTDNRTTASGILYDDSDLSVFAWTGTGAPTPGGTTLNSTTSMASSGWKLIGNYMDVGSKANNSVATTSGTFSSYWLISSYNALYGGTADRTFDAFKVLAISATNCSGAQCPGTGVPEPVSLALFGVALMGVVVSRRRGQTAT